MGKTKKKMKTKTKRKRRREKKPTRKKRRREKKKTKMKMKMKTKTKTKRKRKREASDWGIRPIAWLVVNRPTVNTVQNAPTIEDTLTENFMTKLLPKEEA